MTCYSKNIIPRKIVVHGDLTRGMTFLGRAEKMIPVLTESLSYNNKKIGSQTLNLGHGEKIVCKSCWGVQEIHIYVNGSSQGQKVDKFECICNCNMSTGMVLLVEDIAGSRFVKSLTVSVCFEEDKYRIYKNILGSDFTPWVEGMKVVVMAYNDFLFDCYNMNFNATGCVPLVDIVNVPHTPDATDSLPAAQWRTTYRVIPMCALGIPKWIQVYD